MWFKIEIMFFYFKVILNKSNIVYNVFFNVVNVYDLLVKVVVIFKCFGVVDLIKYILIIFVKYF